jgi:hypothetical protein
MLLTTGGGTGCRQRAIELQLPNVNRLQLLDFAGSQLKALPSELAQLPGVAGVARDGHSFP